MNAPATERGRAARAVLAVSQDGKTLDQTFGRNPPSPLVSELVYGTLRHYYSLDALVGAQLERSLKTRDLDLRALMLVGAYQLFYTRIPAHAVINETVNACRSLRKPWARGLINAVLRALRAGATEPDPDASADVSKRPSGKMEYERSFELPAWLEERVDGDYGPRADAVKLAWLERAPMSLRVNGRMASPDVYRLKLEAQGLSVSTGHHPEQLVLDSPVPVRTLPGFDEGRVSVQDGGGLFARGLLSPGPGDRVLDACAAPGGKLYHLAETTDARLTGLELRESRFEHLGAERARLHHESVELILGDARLRDWWSGEPFDRILLDAPCSGTGTLRRHPDIKLLRRPADIPAYADEALSLLQNLWSLLAPAGKLVYCTCSVLAEENDGVIARFLDQTPEATIERFELPLGIPTRLGWQLLPEPVPAGQPDLSVDGFYYARLTRREEAR